MSLSLAPISLLNDGLGNLALKGTGYPFTFTYGGNQKIATKTDAKGQQTQYSYDSYARLTEVRHYISGTEDTCQRVDFYYDSNPFDGGSYSFDTSGRLAAVQYKNATINPGFCDTTFQEWYSYNAGGARVGKEMQVIRGGVSLPHALISSYLYDTEGRMTSQKYPDSYSYDYMGNPTVLVTGAILGYTYDVMGRLSALTENGTNNIISSTTYGPASELTAMSGTWGSESRSYNAMKQMTYLSSGSLSIGYNYSSTQNNGKITSQQDYVSGETVTYAYDTLNRLATAGTSAWGQSYAYDGFGNLTDITSTLGTTPEWHAAYSAATNRAGGDCADANGNIGQCAVNPTYSYDVENRIISNGPLVTVEYAYAPDNKRVWRGEFSSGTRTLDEVTFWSVTGQRVGIYDLVSYSGSLWAVIAPGTGTGTEYYFGGKLVKNVSGYVHADRLGSIGKYYPYGQERPSATANGVEKFATYFRDSDTGLDYADQRYHAPGQGRFLAPDPYQASGGARDPGSWNRYAYTGGDPVNRSDPRGLCWGLPQPDKQSTFIDFGDDDCGDGGGGWFGGTLGGGVSIGDGVGDGCYAGATVAYFSEGQSSCIPYVPVQYQRGKPPTCDDLLTIEISSVLSTTPLAGHAADFVSDAREDGIDPRLLVAIAGAESGFDSAANLRAINDPFGVMMRRNRRYVPRPFDTLSDAIAYATDLAATKIDNGLTTVNQLYSGKPGAWCVDQPGNPCSKGRSNVTNLLGLMGGEPQQS